MAESEPSHEARPNRKRKATESRYIKYPRIGDCAEALNVSRTHLWYVLEGIRKGRENLTDDFWAESKKLTAKKARKEAYEKARGSK